MLLSAVLSLIQLSFFVAVELRSSFLCCLASWSLAGLFNATCIAVTSPLHFQTTNSKSCPIQLFLSHVFFFQKVFYFQGLIHKNSTCFIYETLDNLNTQLEKADQWLTGCYRQGQHRLSKVIGEHFGVKEIFCTLIILVVKR